jgi:hypothetical protein
VFRVKNAMKWELKYNTAQTKGNGEGKVENRKSKIENERQINSAWRMESGEGRGGNAFLNIQPRRG